MRTFLLGLTVAALVLMGPLTASAADTVLVIGDSIAQGTGSALSPTKTVAVVGANSRTIAGFDGSGTFTQMVISTGSNDKGQNFSAAQQQSYLRAIRDKQPNAKTVWILPYDAAMKAVVQGVAASYGDATVDLSQFPSSDGLHPSSYSALATSVKTALGSTASAQGGNAAGGAGTGNANAAENVAGTASNLTGLVPCGDASTPCTLCHFITGIANIITRIRDVMFFIGLAIITAMGIVYIVSGGNPKLIETAKNGIKNTLIGIIFILFAWFIVNMVMFYIFSANEDLGVGAQLRGANGYEFSCNATSRSGETVVVPGATTGAPVTSAPGSGAGYYSCNQGKCPADSSIANAVKSNASQIEANFMMAIIQGGEGCNKAKSSAGACGYSQVTAPGRTKVCGLTGTAEQTCAALQNNIQLDINCGAAMVKDFQRYSICKSNGLKSLAACYNAGLTGSCGENNYCVRVMNYYNSC